MHTAYKRDQFFGIYMGIWWSTIQNIGRLKPLAYAKSDTERAQLVQQTKN